MCVYILYPAERKTAAWQLYLGFFHPTETVLDVFQPSGAETRIRMFLQLFKAYECLMGQALTSL